MKNCGLILWGRTIEQDKKTGCGIMALRYFCTTNISTRQHDFSAKILVPSSLSLTNSRMHSSTPETNTKTKSTADNLKSLVNTLVLPSISSSPLHSLHRGNWVKLICGASFEVCKLKHSILFLP